MKAKELINIIELFYHKYPEDSIEAIKINASDIVSVISDKRKQRFTRIRTDRVLKTKVRQTTIDDFIKDVAI